jgi:hypothetical protein
LLILVSKMKFTPLLLSLAAFSVVAHAAPAKPKAKAPAKSAQAKPTASTWKPATAAQRRAAAASVRAQLEAFKRDDWEKAATYQSDGLRKAFGTTARFRAAIENNYPQFADYASIEFDRARALGNRVEMSIRLTGRDGVKLRALYTLIKEKGSYRIEAVQGGALVTPDEDSTFA